MTANMFKGRKLQFAEEWLSDWATVTIVDVGNFTEDNVIAEGNSLDYLTRHYCTGSSVLWKMLIFLAINSTFLSTSLTSKSPIKQKIKSSARSLSQISKHKFRTNIISFKSAKIFISTMMLIFMLTKVMFALKIQDFELASDRVCSIIVGQVGGPEQTISAGWGGVTKQLHHCLVGSLAQWTSLYSLLRSYMRSNIHMTQTLRMRAAT